MGRGKRIIRLVMYFFIGAVMLTGCGGDKEEDKIVETTEEKNTEQEPESKVTLEELNINPHDIMLYMGDSEGYSEELYEKDKFHTDYSVYQTEPLIVKVRNCVSGNKFDLSNYSYFSREGILNFCNGRWYQVKFDDDFRSGDFFAIDTVSTINIRHEDLDKKVSYSKASGGKRGAEEAYLRKVNDSHLSERGSYITFKKDLVTYFMWVDFFNPDKEADIKSKCDISGYALFENGDVIYYSNVMESSEKSFYEDASLYTSEEFLKSCVSVEYYCDDKGDMSDEIKKEEEEKAKIRAEVEATPIENDEERLKGLGKRPEDFMKYLGTPTESHLEDYMNQYMSDYEYMEEKYKEQILANKENILFIEKKRYYGIYEVYSENPLILRVRGRDEYGRYKSNQDAWFCISENGPVLMCGDKFFEIGLIEAYKEGIIEGEGNGIDVEVDSNGVSYSYIIDLKENYNADGSPITDEQLKEFGGVEAKVAEYEENGFKIAVCLDVYSSNAVNIFYNVKLSDNDMICCHMSVTLFENPTEDIEQYLNEDFIKTIFSVKDIGSKDR